MSSFCALIDNCACFSVCNSVVARLWGKKAGRPMQALNLGWPVGALLGPLIAIPFVSEEEVVDDTNSTLNASTFSLDIFPDLSQESDMGTYEGMAVMDTYQYEADTHQYKPDTYQREFPDDSSIEIAYLIAATITTAVGCLHFTLYAYFMLHGSRTSSDNNQIALTAADDDNKNLELNQANDSTICPHNSAWGKGDDVKNNNNVAEAPVNALEKCDDVTSASKDAMTWRDIVTPSKWAAGDGRFGVIIALLTVLFYMFLLFSAKGVGGYLTVYAVDSGLGFTNAEAARLQSAVMVFAIVGDASAMFLAKYWSAGVMLVIQTHGQLMTTTRTWS